MGKSLVQAWDQDHRVIFPRHVPFTGNRHSSFREAIEQLDHVVCPSGWEVSSARSSTTGRRSHRIANAWRFTPESAAAVLGQMHGARRTPHRSPEPGARYP